ncbi:hypothetical protein [Desulfurobacterium sp.]
MYYKYFSDIKNPESRLLCTIAAYNGGPGGVARAFTGTTKLYLAEKKINAMTPKEVYRVLTARAPMRETRNYVKKVYNGIKFYKNYKISNNIMGGKDESKKASYSNTHRCGRNGWRLW